MRLFVSIIPPSNVIEKIIQCQQFLKISDVKIIKPDNLHITVCFLGNVDSKNAPTLIKTLDSINFAPFTLELQSIELIPQKCGSIIWLSIKSHALKNFSSLIHKLLQINHNKEFQPHITLARSNQQISNSIFQNYRADINCAPESWTVNYFYLQESKLSPHGAEYTILKEFTLK